MISRSNITENQVENVGIAPCDDDVDDDDILFMLSNIIKHMQCTVL